MIRAKITDDKWIVKNIINFDKSILNADFTSELSSSRLLSLDYTVNLNNFYTHFKDGNANLILEIDHNLIGFTKNINQYSHILPYGSTGQGSETNSLVLLDNSFVLDYNSDYQFDLNEYTEFYSESRLRKAYYIKNPYYTGTVNKYLLYPVQLEQNNRDSSQDIEALKNQVYQRAIEKIKRDGQKLSINGQKAFENGLVQTELLSSSYELKLEKRLYPLNQDYYGSLSYFLSLMNSDKFIFDVIEDKNIFIEANTKNLYDLLNEEVCIGRLSWREEGMININGRLKTLILVGDFNSLNVEKRLRRQLFNNIFEKKNYISGIEENYPSFSIDQKINEFILEGTKLKLEASAISKNIQGKKINIFKSYSQEQIFKGYNNVNISNFFDI